MYKVYKNLIIATLEVQQCKDIEVFEKSVKELPVEAVEALYELVTLKTEVIRSMPQIEELAGISALNEHMLNILTTNHT